ncbi:uncharacterized protein LOC126778318 [Nymphalis io]|uniref:uncharacterized protein LOC126778318 n=1 Tax=Inachis io TaxID=171585 RepID=UPI00216AAE74|nr:uncharacterized protein LOC126778318 [Nymphalis io]
MAKFIKSIFHNSDRRRSSRYEESEDDKPNAAPPLDGRRKLSISRSGRMRQANRKRHSLSLELYNHEIQMTEKIKSNEYHTNNQKQTVIDINQTTNFSTQLNQSTEIKTPEEEIDIAFEIIEKI